MSYLTVCMNPALQKTLRFSSIISDTVNRTAIHRLDVSGKGINVTRVLNQLGKKAVHLTQLGGVMRSLFLSLCEADSLSVEWVESGSPIRFCYTLVGDNDSSVTELVEESEPVEAGTGDRLLEKFEKLLEGRKCLIVSGTKAAGFSDSLVPLMTRKAKERGLTVILDVRGKDLTESLRYGPDIIKPNLREFVSTFAPDLIQDGDLSGDEPGVKARIGAAALDICKKYNCRVILTRGSQKIWAFENENFFEICFEAIRPVNTTGSGDAFTAGLAAALEDGAGFADAIAEGARCGALNARCLKPGVIRQEPPLNPAPS
jgi:1-phosphofructokinase/tagatose 6-phosphate kinase